MRTDQTTQPVCPHCGHKMRDAWELEWDNECISVDCGDCGREYIVCIQTTITYSTYPPRDDTT